MHRELKKQIQTDLKKKMVILAGPRQVGKTWLAQNLAKDFQNPLYLNYDILEHRELIQKKAWSEKCDFLIFDEIHKMKNWKNFLKGVVDGKAKSLSILVTGSARLNTFRKSGDALAGRFYLHHLMPFTLSELADPTKTDEVKLIERGGFPEPFLSDDATDAKRWQKLYQETLLREEIFGFEKIFQIRAMEHILEKLMHSVGSPVSYQSLARDTQVTPPTVKHYIDILEELYIVFRVTPFAKNISRSLVKEPKIYFYNTGFVQGDAGAKFENHVAVHLLKHTLMRQDLFGENCKLHNLKTKEKKEIDFCLVQNQKITKVIECKTTDDSLASALQYFCEKYDLHGVQLVLNSKLEKQFGKISIEKSLGFLREL